MDRIEVEILTNVGGFSVDFGGQVLSFPITRTSKKGVPLHDSIFIVEGLKVLWWLRNFFNCCGL
jgi:hypothetical protein